MRKLGIALVVALVGLGLAFTVYVNAIAGAAVEKGATYALGVDTRVRLVRLALLDGSFRLAGLRVANPTGFESDRFLALGSGRLDVDLGSVREPTLVVPILALDDVDLVLEKRGGRSNYGAILANLKRFESSKPESAERAEPAGPGKKYVVREIVIRDVDARVQVAERIGRLGRVNVHIPEIRLRDVGSESQGGVVVSQLTNVVLKAILTAVAKQGGGLLPQDVVGGLRSGLGGLERVAYDVSGQVTGEAVRRVGEAVTGDAARQVGEKVGEIGGDAGKAAAEQAGKALRGLGGLLGGEREGED